MDPNEAAVEAEVQLDQERLVERQADTRQGHEAAKAAKGGVEIRTDAVSNYEPEPDEASPLLTRRSGDEADRNRQPSRTAIEDFSHLPWHKRPSVWWIVGPFLVVALAFGGMMAPKLNLILELICREYIDEIRLKDPTLKLPSVDFNGGDNDQCRIPEVQSKVAQFTLIGSLLTGLLSAITAPKLGELSDRYGRKTILLSTSVGTILSELITIAAARNPEVFPVNWLLLGYALDGLTGSFIVAMAIANSYATDCTPPQMRNVAFGYFHGCLFTGLAAGPIIAGKIVQASGKIVTIFYVMLCAHGAFILFVALFTPESLSKKRQHMAREKRKSWLLEMGPEYDWINRMRSWNLLEPLKILWPTGPGTSSALRRNLFFLAAVDTIVFGVAMGSMTVVIIYTNYMFGWKTYESGRFMSIVSTSRVLCLLVGLPLATRLVRGPPSKSKQRDCGSDTFDLSIIRLAVFMDTLGYLGYTLSRAGSLMTLSGAVAAVGGIGSPTLQSALTKHVPADKTGQLLGAVGLLHALARVAGPVVFNAIYAATVGKFTQTVFVCLTATFGVAFIISWFIKPHVYLDELAAQEEEEEESAENSAADTASQAGRKRARYPIVDAVSITFKAAGASVLRLFRAAPPS